MKTVIRTAIAFFIAAPMLGAEQPRDLDTPRTFPEISTRAEWKERAQKIREHVQFACGLWPMPEKTPLNANVFDRIERDGYSIEKVYFESYPGFFVAGNLYRPAGRGDGPFPAILNPHGHWRNGRMANEELGSIAARCINFARQGMIAFSYDMVGYNDTVQVDHKFASDPTNLLWNISLMGLQTWNSIRALDFLETLPDADKTRLACTGESGGGTQTFILGAIDKRLAAQAPIVMVSHSMQGGCLCENAPGLRVDYSNMEIAAAPAPRPQIIVGATGDWTKKTMEVEGPAIEKIYALFKAPENFDYTIFDFDHNYNKTTREAVYASFGKWLLKEKNPDRLKEKAYTKEPDSDLRVFPDGKLPAGALKEPELIQSLVRIYSQQLENRSWNARRRAEMLNAWEHALQLQHVRGMKPAMNGDEVTIVREPDQKVTRLTIQKASGKNRSLVLLASDSTPDLARSLHEAGFTVVTLKHKRQTHDDQFKKFFHTYNRTRVQDHVAAIKVAVEYLDERYPRAKIFLVGHGDAGPAALMAAPLVSGTAADCAGLDETEDSDLLKPEIFFPGIRRLGSFQDIARFGGANPLFVHNVARLLPMRSSVSGPFRQQKERASEAEILQWVQQVARR